MAKPLNTAAYTASFLAQAKSEGVSEAELAALEKMISADPTVGELIVGSGGCRKVRLAGKGKGRGKRDTHSFLASPKGVSPRRQKGP